MTVQELIDDALTDLGVIAPGETPTAEERAYALRKANQMLDSLSAQGLPLYQITAAIVALTGASNYALATRPLKIKAASVNAGGMTTEIDVVTAEEFAKGDKLKVLYWDGGFPTSNIYIRPAVSGGTLDLYTYVPLTQFASLSTTVAFPAGYERALRTALALELATGFGRAVTQVMVDLANDAKTSIQGLNQAALGAIAPAAQG